MFTPYKKAAYNEEDVSVGSLEKVDMVASP
jgi:hypothetical protein